MSLLDLERKEQELEQLRMDCEHFKARLESVQEDSVSEKKVRCSQGPCKVPALWPWPQSGAGRSPALKPQDVAFLHVFIPNGLENSWSFGFTTI